MNRPFVIPPPLRTAQARASDPSGSAWVSASAGSGKTHVLAQRVLRLLLNGTPPAQILGLTYTKAAAANMADRIFATLAKWTTLSDEELAGAIVETGAAVPDSRGLEFARRLFARTLETPGGVKIQTLHAFCERLLRLFPFEANVAAHFKVIDEREAGLRMEQARSLALGELQASACAASLDLVAREAGAAGADPLLREALAHGQILEAFGTATDYAAALRNQLRLPPGVTSANVEAQMIGGDGARARRKTWAGTLESGKDKDRQFAAKLRAVDREDAADARRERLLDAFFLTNGGQAGVGPPRGGERCHLTTKRLRERLPALEADLKREQERLIELRDRRRAALVVERTEALFVVAKAILATFARLKAERGELDFADQIARALALVTQSSAAWVLHKLDYGLDHLLVDEAQDTSSEQWSILAALSAEFFAGEGARKADRTVFAVGDEKQSIFSFQGAAPEQFTAMKRYFEKRHRESGRAFEDVPLNFSFRSSPAILKAVDKTFENEFAWRGVTANGEPAPAHEAIHRQMEGVVELWPPVVSSLASERRDWRMPLDEPSRDEPAVTLARRIAAVIRDWVAPDSRERVIEKNEGSPRKIRESDVMILVRKRGVFFEAMIRALKDKGVKTAGADRLKLPEHIAVMDLIAAGRAALAPDDDLILACVLKSPLIGLDDEDLFRLAMGRPGSLAAALEASQDQRATNAARRIAAWRKRAETLTPYAFYARILGEDGGRRALIGRLGPDAADPVDEFLALALAHERRETASLHIFLAEADATAAPIKRDMEGESEGVRVLTIHASKGLEAPIVFLPDTCSAPDPRQEPRLTRLNPADPDSPPLFAWSGRRSEDPGALVAAREAWREAGAGEHRRLLYVAMTRAAQRLIVAGYQKAGAPPPDCWYELVRSGLAHSMARAAAPWNAGETILRFGEGACAGEGGGSTDAAPPPVPPGWINARPPPEGALPSLSPSRAEGVHEGGGERVEHGRLAHGLLQFLPDVASDRRPAAAKAYLDAEGGALSEPARAALATQVLAVIEMPELAAVFAPGSLGEVSLAGVLRRPGHAKFRYSGRLDRLAVTKAGIFIVDFKLGAAPARPAAAHVAQLALYRAALKPLYPGVPALAALVYLGGPNIVPVGETELDEALAATAAAR